MQSSPKPPAVLPKHVQHCHNATKSWEWVIFTWRRDRPDVKSRRPYTCNSWRCTGERTIVDAKTGALRVVNPCARHDASVMFARMKQATEPLSADGWVFFVLTLDRLGYYSGEKKWPDATAAFRELGHLSHKFLTRLRGHAKRQGWRVPGNEWVATVEQHASGWPHVNVMIHCPELAEELREEKAWREAKGWEKRDLITVTGSMRAIVEGAGFGRQSTAEGARDVGKVLNYITKLAGPEMGRTVAELSKLTQSPTAAPERFRRLRAGKNFLPPRRKDANVTGTLVRRGRDQFGSPLVLPLHNAKPELAPHIAECCYAEERQWLSELAIPRLLAVRAKPGLVSTFTRRGLEHEAAEQAEARARQWSEEDTS